MAEPMQYPSGLRLWTERALQRCSSQAEARHVAEQIQVCGRRRWPRPPRPLEALEAAVVLIPFCLSCAHLCSRATAALCACLSECDERLGLFVTAECCDATSYIRSHPITLRAC